jgi:hypothetical protein
MAPSNVCLFGVKRTSFKDDSDMNGPLLLRCTGLTCYT